jgi:threonine dehydrogenase-like Zn-dependent dehydrogenase
MGVYTHQMGIVEGGKLALIAAAGPMGLGALTYALHCDRRPGLVVVADINQDRLDRAARLFDPEEVKAETGIELRFVNNGEFGDADAQVEGLRAFTGGTGFDDVFCYAPISSVAALSNAILGRDGCMNFFAGPTDKKLTAPINLYDVHYNSTHLMGTSGGNTADEIESLELTAAGRIDPAVMVTHVGGLDAAAETTLNLPKIPGGKKLIYTHVSMPLVSLDELRDHAAEDERFSGLADIVEGNNGLWCPAAERYLLENWSVED